MKYDLNFEEALAYGTATVTGVTAFIYAVKKLIKSIRNKGEQSDNDKKSNKKCDKCGLCNHKLFVMLKVWIKETNHHNWRCCNKYKTAIGRDLIKIKFETGIDYLQKAFCKMANLDTKEEVYQEFCEVIRSLVDNYTAKWIQAGIPEVIVTKINEYHNKNARIIERVVRHDRLKDYLSTDEYIRNILNMLIIPYTIFIQDVRTILDKANGSLSGQVYNYIINDNTVCDVSGVDMSYIEDED